MQTRIIKISYIIVLLVLMTLTAYFMLNKSYLQAEFTFVYMCTLWFIYADILKSKVKVESGHKYREVLELMRNENRKNKR